jgi:hypothetical protein
MLRWQLSKLGYPLACDGVLNVVWCDIGVAFGQARHSQDLATLTSKPPRAVRRWLSSTPPLSPRRSRFKLVGRGDAVTRQFRAPTHRQARIAASTAPANVIPDGWKSGHGLTVHEPMPLVVPDSAVFNGNVAVALDQTAQAAMLFVANACRADSHTVLTWCLGKSCPPY